MTETEHESDAHAVEPSSAAVRQPELTTERLLLRPFCVEDATQLQQLLQCREIAANTRSIEHPYPEGAAKIWIESHPELWNIGKSAIFAICKIQNPKTAIGAIGLEINSENEHAELGYWVGEPYWGLGMCTEAGKAIVEFGFEWLGLHRIHAHHLARNPASGRVLEKIGMVREGRLVGHFKKWGVFEDIIWFGMVNAKK